MWSLFSCCAVSRDVTSCHIAASVCESTAKDITTVCILSWALLIANGDPIDSGGGLTLQVLCTVDLVTNRDYFLPLNLVRYGG